MSSRCVGSSSYAATRRHCGLRNRRRSAPASASQQTPEEAAMATYQDAFGWAGPPPVFIDLTGGADDDKGKGKAVY